jgi:hypothetical protein
MKFSRKLLSVMREEPFENLNTISMRIGTTIQNNKEDTTNIITRAENTLKQSLSSEVTLL